jgi:RNA polymerase sigma factor (sigma-70 family)
MSYRDNPKIPIRSNGITPEKDYTLLELINNSSMNFQLLDRVLSAGFLEYYNTKSGVIKVRGENFTNVAENINNGLVIPPRDNSYLWHIELLDCNDTRLSEHTKIYVPERDKKQELELVIKAQMNHYPALDRLFMSNRKYVHDIAKHYYFNNKKIPFLDVFQEGNKALSVAFQHFDPDEGNVFISYSCWWIRQHIKLLYHNDETVKRPFNHHDLSNKLKSIERKLRGKLGREPTLYEIAEETDSSFQSITDAIFERKSVFSLDWKPDGSDSDESSSSFTSLDFLESNEKPSDQNIFDDESVLIADSLLRIVEVYDERPADRVVYRLREFGEMSLSDMIIIDAFAKRNDKGYGSGFLLDNFGFSHVGNGLYHCDKELKLQDLGDAFGVTRERIRQMADKTSPDFKKRGRAVFEGKVVICYLSPSVLRNYFGAYNMMSRNGNNNKTFQNGFLVNIGGSAVIQALYEYAINNSLSRKPLTRIVDNCMSRFYSSLKKSGQDISYKNVHIIPGTVTGDMKTRGLLKAMLDDEDIPLSEVVNAFDEKLLRKNRLSDLLSLYRSKERILELF